MQPQYKKKAAYLGALSLFFGVIELFVPKILPFFRLGLANIPILLALDMPLKPFLMLLLLKGIGNSYIAGNLFSFFSIISISQSLVSGLAMYSINKAKPNRYAISAFGALASTITQITLAMLYVGEGVLSFMPLMLCLSLASSILVAFASERLEISSVPELISKSKTDKTGWPLIMALLLSSIAIMLESSMVILSMMVIAAFILQRLSGRRIMIIPHITIFIFMVISALLSPNGMVLGSIGSFPITQGALLTGITKALKLSGTIAISQSYSRVLQPGDNILGEMLAYFTALLSAFKKEKGTLKERAIRTMTMETLEEVSKDQKRAPDSIFISFAFIFIAMLLIPIPIV